MKKKWVWILLGSVAALLVAVIAVRMWFTSPGIRVFGNEIHVDLSEECYIIDGQTGELLNETTVIIKGATDRNDQSLFDGELKIIGYQNSADGEISALKAIETTESGCWTITHLENCTHQEEDDNGITKPVEHFCDYSYTYYLYPNEPDKLVVLIESFSVYKPLYAVCADSAEAALVRYEEFMKDQP